MDTRRLPIPDWSEGMAAQDAFFGSLRTSSHAFATDHQSWLKPSEPQVTKGWQHFLSDRRCSPDTRLARQLAFLRALLGSADTLSLPADGERVEVESEVYGRHGGRDRYVDLVLRWIGTDNTRCAVAVEFKFSHHVTHRQLSDYREIMKRRVGDASKLRLVVVLADHRSYPPGKRRSKNWRVLLWRNLLRRIEKQDPDADPEFARFRNIAWHRTHA